jgi:hypothetical protein
MFFNGSTKAIVEFFFLTMTKLDLKIHVQFQVTKSDYDIPSNKEVIDLHTEGLRKVKKPATAFSP